MEVEKQEACLSSIVRIVLVLVLGFGLRQPTKCAAGKRNATRLDADIDDDAP